MSGSRIQLGTLTLDLLAWKTRHEILRYWRMNHAPLSGAFSSVELYISLLLHYGVTETSHPATPNLRFVPKPTATNALYAVLKTMQMLGDFQNVEDIAFFPPILHNQPFWGLSSSLKLGINFDQAIGMALYDRYHGIKRKTIVVVSDAELQEGVDHQALLANNLGLSNLCVIIDANGYGSSYAVSDIDPAFAIDPNTGTFRLKAIWQSYGWAYFEVDGHNWEELFDVFDTIEKQELPQVVVAKTRKGKGLPVVESNPVAHTHYLTDTEYDECIHYVSEQIRICDIEMGNAANSVDFVNHSQSSSGTVQSALRLPLGAEGRLPNTDQFRDGLQGWIDEFTTLNPGRIFALDTDNPVPFDRTRPFFSRNESQTRVVVGLNERSALNIARGIAKSGAYPIYTSPATHLQVCAEDFAFLAIEKQPVLLIGYAPGSDLAYWGPTHTCYRDCLLFGTPDAHIFQPATIDDLYAILSGIYSDPYLYLPAYLRLPKVATKLHWPWLTSFENAFRRGFYTLSPSPTSETDVIYVSSGSTLAECIVAAESLSQEGIRTAVVNILSLTNIDLSALQPILENSEVIISVFDGDPSCLANLLLSTVSPLNRRKIQSKGVTGFGAGLYVQREVWQKYRIDAASLVFDTRTLVTLPRYRH